MARPRIGPLCDGSIITILDEGRGQQPAPDCSQSPEYKRGKATSVLLSWAMTSRMIDNRAVKVTQ